MKKKFGKRLIAFGMALILTVGLCACGNENQSEGGSGKNKKNENAALAKENVYHVQEIELPKFYEPGNGNINVYGTAQIDGKINMLIQVYDYNVYNEYDFRLLTMNEDGSSLQVTNLEFPEKPAEEETGEQDNAQTGEQSEEGESDVAVEPYDSSQVDEYTGYGNFVMTKSGQIYGIKNHNKNDYSDPENYINESTSYLCRWDVDGSFCWEKEIPELKNDGTSWIGVNNMMEVDGTLYMILGGEHYSKLKVDSEGNVVDKKDFSDEEAAIFNNTERLIAMKDGKLMSVFHDESDWSKTYTAEYDLVTDAVSEKKELPGSILSSWDYNFMTADDNSNLLYTGGAGIYQYQDGDTEAKLKMNYINSDFFVNNFMNIIELSDTSFLGVYMEDGEEGVKAGIFSYVKPEDIVDKTVMVVAGQWIDYNLKKRVIDYNKNNQQYRIVLKDYSQYNTYEDYTAGQTKLNNDIIAGDIPDILYTNGLPMENYISKGLIADIGKLIAEDPELSQVEFMQNVFDAYSMNDKLYYIVPEFQVSTVVAKKKFTGDRTGWSMDDVKQVLATMGEGASAFGQTSRNNFMYMVMRYCGSEFMNMAEGKCYFNTDAFISMMEYAKTLPSEEEINSKDEADWELYWQNYQSQYREDHTLMMQTELYNFMWLSETMNGYFGEDISFIGFPSGNGKGAYLSCSQTYALSAKSANLDAAWDFMRYYLTDEYQKEVYSFPVNKKIFMEKSKEAMERPYWIDENGEKQYYDNSMYINGEEIILEPLTQQQLDQVVSYLETVNTTYYYNEFINNIINEEIEAFFTGQKSAKDVADIIQRRAQIYIDENR